MTYQVKKLTPVLIVDAIEPCIPFWTSLGFAQTVTLPEGDAIGFVILVKDEIEVMYQSVASVKKDVAVFAKSPKGGTHLFIEVSDLDDVVKKVPKGTKEAFARRKTFYGMEEIGVFEPGGNAITFAMPVE